MLSAIAMPSPATPSIVYYGILFAILLFVIWMCCRILAKAGLSPAIGFLGIVPYAGVIAVLAILTFSRWPNMKESAIVPNWE